MHNPYRGGTPDVWYSGTQDCWIEYKWLPTQPKKARAPALSELQKKWLRDRFFEGRTVMVIVGSPGMCYLYNTPAAWEDGSVATELASAKEVAEHIASVCT